MKLKENAWLLLSIIVSAFIALEGAMWLLLVKGVTIKGNPMLSGDVTTLGVVLLFIGLASLAFGILTIMKPLILKENLRLLIISKLVKIIGGGAIALEGVMLALIAGMASIEGLGTYETYIWALFAGQLFFIGIALLWLELISFMQFKLTRLLMYLGGIVIAAEGVVVIGIADPTIIDGLGGILERTVLMAGTALLFLSLVYLVSCYLVDLAVRFKSAFSALKLVSGAFLVVGGLALTTIATNVTPEDIGTITTRTVMLAGLQLTLIAGISLLASGSMTNSPSRHWGRLSTATALFLMLLLPTAFLTVGKFW
ncbi:MAG: hypothetical protein QW520_04760 [Methanomassiliicoccales archaeon]